jgi:hypothetical protein
MYATKDSLLSVEVIDNVDNAVLPAVDFVIADYSDAILKQLNDMSIANTVALLVSDNSSVVNVDKTKFDQFEFDSMVSITYDKAKKNSKIKLISLSETGCLIHKGDPLALDKSIWFQGGEEGPFQNATNHWDLTRNIGGAVEHATATVQGEFHWDLALIMMSLTKTQKCRKFVYARKMKNDVNLFMFLKTYNIACHVYANTTEKALELINSYNGV